MIITSYYLMSHMYTLVPRHVREDMEWMADKGNHNVAISVLEQDLYASKWNMDILIKEANRVGMGVLAVPSRWGGLVAGAPKVPSHFTVTRPDTWMLNRDGSPVIQNPQGPMSSIYHPDTEAFFKQSLEQLLTEWDFSGVIWDEPKMLGTRDFSPAALKIVPEEASMENHLDEAAKFFDRLGTYARTIKPSIRLSLFMYANERGYAVERFACISSLNDFGCDGRPWYYEDGGTLESQDKTLLGQAERFLDAARVNGKNGLILIENHNMDMEDMAKMEHRLPEVLALEAEHLMYYYYPRNVSDPDRMMSFLGDAIQKFSETKPDKRTY